MRDKLAMLGGPPINHPGTIIITWGRDREKEGEGLQDRVGGVGCLQGSRCHLSNCWMGGGAPNGFALWFWKLLLVFEAQFRCSMGCDLG